MYSIPHFYVKNFLQNFLTEIVISRFFNGVFLSKSYEKTNWVDRWNVKELPLAWPQSNECFQLNILLIYISNVFLVSGAVTNFLKYRPPRYIPYFLGDWSLRADQFKTIHLNSREEAFNHIHLQLGHLLLCEAPRVTLRAVVNPGLDIFASV